MRSWRFRGGARVRKHTVDDLFSDVQVTGRVLKLLHLATGAIEGGVVLRCEVVPVKTGRQADPKR